jgi:hypothetical protein
VRLLVLIACCFCVTALRAQKFDCPMLNGVVIESKRVGLIPPHTDPRNGMNIYSTIDSIFCVASGEVAGVAEHSSKSYSVIVRIDSTTIVAYAFLEKTSVKKGDHLKTGDYIGKPECFEGKFRLRLSLYKRSAFIDPRDFFNCVLSSE